MMPRDYIKIRVCQKEKKKAQLKSALGTTAAAAVRLINRVRRGERRE
jgi:hypothetical protein